MCHLRRVFVFFILPLFTVVVQAQSTNASSPKASAVHAKDIDPLALDVLHAVVQPVEQAESFTFKALISEEDLASDGQIVTFFRVVDVRVQRPGKIHLLFQGLGQQIEFYTSNGTTTMFAPVSKLYTTFPTKGSIDEMLTSLNAKGIDLAIAPFLRTNFYEMAAKTVTTGYVIGRVNVFDQAVHQLAFTAPDADWQVWVTGGEAPRFVRIEVINKKLEGKPRTIIQFLDWNLSPHFGADEFNFAKPADALEIAMLPSVGGKVR